ncbi:MAG: peptidoglycan bridge formation glycyltransferase FemA/FemB family protein [Bdellovibrionia bacterium]
MSQTLAWGDAIAALGGQAYLVFSPDEGVGGLVHSVDGGLECINGPYLHWDQRSQIARQFATFAMAMAKLESSFSFLRIQPRWSQSLLETRLGSLPISPKEVFRASTLQMKVHESESERLAAVTPRLRRSLSVARRAPVKVRSQDADPRSLAEFASQMKVFGQSKGFYVPDAAWLHGLAIPDGQAPREDLRFIITEAQADGALTQLLTCIQKSAVGSSAHYLFGYDQREEGARASVSTAAVAHFHVLERCASLGIETYDLNGFTNPDDAEHSYSGVSRFKSQFRGQVIDYASPQFWIEN